MTRNFTASYDVVPQD